MQGIQCVQYAFLDLADEADARVLTPNNTRLALIRHTNFVRKDLLF
jgi:hypothetical protein